MVLAAFVILFLILLTGLYVAAEFAAVGARRSRLRRLAEDGNGLAARILPVVEDPHELDRYIAVSQVGITLSSLILGAYGQAALAPVLAPLIQALVGLDAATAQSTAAVLVLLVLTACSAPVAIPEPTPDEAGRAVCTALVAALPDLVLDAERRRADPGLLTAAWGEPPITLRCGVAAPPGLTASSECLEVNGVGWFAEDELPEWTIGAEQWGRHAFAAIRGEPRPVLFDPPRANPWHPA